MSKCIILLFFGIVVCNVLAKPIEPAENVTEVIDEDYVNWDDPEDEQDTYVNNSSDSDLDEGNAVSDAQDYEEEDDQHCEVFCPRIYRPVCAQIKGVTKTVPTRCELDNKIRCASASYGPVAAATLYTFLHNGPCGNNETDVSEEN